MRNPPAVWSVLLGLLAVAAIPAAAVYADRSARVQLIWAGIAVPAAFVLGLLAIAAARAARRRAQMTLLGPRGSTTARVGSLLGTLGLLLAGTGSIALLVYAILTYRGRA